MKVEIIIIGDELLQGKIFDKNTSWLATQLIEHGIQLTSSTIVADQAQALEFALKNAWQRSDLVITSGGLGPTKDDQTKNILASFFKKTLKESQAAWEIIERHYQQRSREYKKETHHYHLIPQGFTPLYNPAGYAPGLKFDQDNKLLFCFPGVPKEFKEMVSEYINPLIDKNKNKFELVTIKTSGIAESKIFNELCPNLWQQLEEFGAVSSLPHLSGVDIGVKITSHLFREKVIELINSSALKPHVLCFEQKTYEKIVVEEASKKSLTLGFAESCTGGLNSSRITDVPGSSKVFMGSVISYSNEVKMEQLKVSKDSLENFGAVSEEVAMEMAQGLREKLNLDIAISTTGIAGPGGGSIEKPVGTVCIGVSSKFGTISERFQFFGDREKLKNIFSDKSYLKLIEELKKFD